MTALGSHTCRCRTEFLTSSNSAIFAILLTYFLSQASVLWDKYKDSMNDDILHSDQDAFRSRSKIDFRQKYITRR
ncbi:hypothetical protein CEXT_74761 [Caerostris extrusa]|uniref:Uncharacterized protein n=1 Tax=Caerostris extrusa TaxID=172846 RepID=A0AAV4T7T0_CAEEX|nr:hypothetical protein CEXT_74761 [Caerostris extrusa]